MWFPPDPDEPISELYRLTPPRRQRSEIREALDAAHGIDNPADDDPIVVISPQQPWWRDLAARATSASRRCLGGLGVGHRRAGRGHRIPDLRLAVRPLTSAP